MTDKVKEEQIIEELIDDKKDYLPKKDRDIIMFNVRKIIEDMASLTEYINQYSNHYSTTDKNRIQQYIKNNQTRAKTVVWQLTSTSFKKNKGKEDGRGK